MNTNNDKQQGVKAYLVTSPCYDKPSLCFEDERDQYDEDAIFTELRAAQSPQPVAMPDDETIMKALRDAKPREKEYAAATHVRWKDGIDIDEPATWLTNFARILLAASPAPQAVPEDWRHIANEWADECCNAMQCVKNIKDGLSAPDEAIASIQHGIDRCRALAAPKVAEQPLSADMREWLGKMVRAEWMRWAAEQPNPKPSWLTPWNELTEPEREVDRRIGECIWNFSYVRDVQSKQPEQPQQEPTRPPLPDEPLWDSRGNVRHDAVDRYAEKRKLAAQQERTRPIQALIAEHEQMPERKAALDKARERLHAMVNGEQQERSDSFETTACDWCKAAFPCDSFEHSTEADDAICNTCAEAAQRNGGKRPDAPAKDDGGAGEAVAWQYRVYHTDPDDPGWGVWHNVSKAEYDFAITRKNTQGRELFDRPAPAQAQGVDWQEPGPVTATHPLECLIIIPALRQSDGDWYIDGGRFLDMEAPILWTADTEHSRAALARAQKGGGA